MHVRHMTEQNNVWKIKETSMFVSTVSSMSSTACNTDPIKCVKVFSQSTQLQK